MKNKRDLSKLAFVSSSAFLLFMYGVLVGTYGIFPFEILKFAQDSVEEVWSDRSTITLTRPEGFLRPSRYDGEGATRANLALMAPGLTFVVGFFDGSNEMRLIKADGEIVNRWPVRFSDIFPDPSHIEPPDQRPANDWGTDINGSVLLPDGSVVFNFDYKGMVKLDRCGTVEWTVPRMTHHSIDLSEGGFFWVGGRRYEDQASEFPPLETPYFEDTVLKVSPDGRVLKEFSVPGLFFNNNLYSVLLANGFFEVSNIATKEIVHLNDVEELSAELADQFPGFRSGDLVLSMRNLNLLMVVDPEKQEVKWHQTGPYMRQHDPDFQAGGVISIFDNNSDGAQGEIFGGSRILFVSPGTGEVVVRYGAQGDQKMYTEIRGQHQILRNGNALITESLGGRVFEVTRGGEIVWEFINRYDEDEVIRVNDAIRYPEDYFTVEDWHCGQ